MAGARIVDRGWLRIKTEVQDLRGRGVKVGLLSGGPSNDGVPVVEYATFNEFGTATIPARPFMRKTADDAKTAYTKFAGNTAYRVIAGRINSDKALDTIGLWYQDRIQTSIRQAFAWAKPNAPSTIAAKGSSKPLIDDAVMIGAVKYEKTRI